MASHTPGMISFFTGLIAYTLVMIASYLYHRRKKMYSFIIREKENEVIVKRSPLTNTINAIAHFFMYSLITIVTIANKNQQTAFIQLSIIYTICLIVVLIEYYFRASFQILIDRKSKILKTKDTVYLFQDIELEICDRSFWLRDDYDAYGLYIKTKNGKSKLLYGTSVLWDIRELKTQMENSLHTPDQ